MKNYNNNEKHRMIQNQHWNVWVIILSNYKDLIECRYIAQKHPEIKKDFFKKIEIKI
jgi:hypothetical protein